MSVLIAIAAFLVALGVLVTVHEYGHYWVARRSGVRVLRFSIGFGKPLWTRTARDGTEWVVAAIPLGGYVKMLDERDPEAPAGDLAQSFNRAHPLRKIAISLAGPAANFLFAIFAYWLIFVIGFPGLKPVIGEVMPDTPAAYAGMQQGDRFLRVAGTGTATWESAYLALLDGASSGQPFEVVVEGADGYPRTLSITAGPPRELTEPGALFPGLGIQPWRPLIPARLGEIEPGGAAERDGLMSGDLILAVDDDSVRDWTDLVGRIQASPGRTVRIGLERQGRRQVLEVTIGVSEGGLGRVGAGVQVPEGLYEGMQAEQRFGFLEAIPKGIARTGEMSWLTLKMLARMVTGDVSVKNISGPIDIAKFAGYSASSGFIDFLSFMAIVSISLGIINLLPIPILDGGHLLYHLTELVKGRPVSEQTEIVGQRIGLGMLALLMGLAFYNDLTRIFG